MFPIRGTSTVPVIIGSRTLTDSRTTIDRVSTIAGIDTTGRIDTIARRTAIDRIDTIVRCTTIDGVGTMLIGRKISADEFTVFVVEPFSGSCGQCAFV